MTTSASAVRIQGDDYQHLFVWYHALRMLDPGQGVTSVEVEAEQAGNVDDLIVRRGAGDEFYQVKYSVDGDNPIDAAWWVTAKSAKGTTPLQKFWASWKSLGGGSAKPHLVLFSNRSLDVRDPLLALREGQHGRLMPRLGAEGPKSAAGKRRSEWATHLGVSEPAMLEMLSHLDLLTDQGAHAQFATRVVDRMAARGLLHDDEAVRRGVDAVRSWVTSGRRVIDRAALDLAIKQKELAGTLRRATFVVEAIDRWPGAAEATASVNWVSLFDGDDPKKRRQLRDPSHWSTTIPRELRAAEERVKGAGYDRVLMRGYMRLPLWFAVGAHFADSRGYTVECVQRSAVWSARTKEAAFNLQHEVTTLGAGDELALGLSVTHDLSADALDAVSKLSLPIGRFVHVRPADGVSPSVFGSDADAKGWALAVRSLLYELRRGAAMPKVHLFLASPAGAAMLLGHYWNRLPPVVFYEDMNPGYAPSIEIS